MLENYLPHGTVMHVSILSHILFSLCTDICLNVTWGCDKDHQSPHPVWYSTVQ